MGHLSGGRSHNRELEIPSDTRHMSGPWPAPRALGWDTAGAECSVSPGPADQYPALTFTDYWLMSASLMASAALVSHSSGDLVLHNFPWETGEQKVSSWPIVNGPTFSGKCLIGVISLVSVVWSLNYHPRHSDSNEVRKSLWEINNLDKSLKLI